MKTPKGIIDDRLFVLLEDEDLMHRMSEAKTPEECYGLVKEKIDIGFEEFQSSMAVALACLKNEDGGILSDDELDQIAGGKTDKAAGISCGIGTVAILCISGAAAAVAA